MLFDICIAPVHRTLRNDRPAILNIAFSSVCHFGSCLLLLYLVEGLERTDDLLAADPLLVPSSPHHPLHLAVHFVERIQPVRFFVYHLLANPLLSILSLDPLKPQEFPVLVSDNLQDGGDQRT